MLRGVAALGDEIEAARAEALADEFFGDVADGDDAAAAEDHAFDFAGVMREAEDAAGRDEFGDVAGGDGEAALAEAEEDEGFGGFVGGRHWGGSRRRMRS